MEGTWLFIDSDVWTTHKKHSRELVKVVKVSGGVVTLQSQYGYTLRRNESTVHRCLASMGPVIKLLILDMNGVIVHRKNTKSSVVARPGLHSFLHEITNHFAVGIWTSAMEHNASRALAAVLSEFQLSRVVAILTRDACVPCPTPEDKYATIKDLSHIWNKEKCWDARNTVLIDDSPQKGARQPHNVIVVPSFDRGARDTDEMFVALLPFLLGTVLPSHDVREVCGRWVCPVVMKSPSRDPSPLTEAAACLRPRPWWPPVETFLQT